MSESQPILDNTVVFEHLWKITQELFSKLNARFDLNPDLLTKDLQIPGSSDDGNIDLTLKAFSGKEIDWLVHSYLRNFGQPGFSTMRLTVWLGSHVRVPHLAFEFGTTPNIFFYIDYIPRTDLTTDLEYLDRYYEPVNTTYLKLQADPNLSPFTSRSTFIRQFQSPSSLCYTCPPSDCALNLVGTLTQEMLERWLTWVDEAEPVPEQARAALIERDRFLRRTSAERDPGNNFAAKVLGQELTDKLVLSLWGGDRIGK